MRSLLYNHKLQLLKARHKRVLRDEFPAGIEPWRVLEGDFHFVTVDTNADKKAGIEEDLLINAAGSYSGGIMEREFLMKEYGEVVFERYVKNDDPSTGSNILNFYVNDALKLSLEGPTPWRRTHPIGVPPGLNRFKFEYIVKGNPTQKSAVIDTFEIHQAKRINTTISKYTPPKPIKNLVQNNTLRGHSRFQQMKASDTSIKFTALFTGKDYLEFITASDEIFYFIDEFDVVYRGIFPENIEPSSIAMNAIYAVNLEMIAPQKAGIGFV